MRELHRERLAACVRDLGSELSSDRVEARLIIPPSLLAEPMPPGIDSAAATKLLEPFSACQAATTDEFAACHLAERAAMRAGLEAGARSSRWQVTDGEGFAPADWDTRRELFADHNHLSPEGNRRFGEWLAGVDKDSN
jgi:hypothetical protein